MGPGVHEKGSRGDVEQVNGVLERGGAFNLYGYTTLHGIVLLS
jgi:hypothetical protein